MSSQSAYRLTHFIRKHQPDWDRLEELIRIFRSRQARHKELNKELGHTYRRVAAHLAYAQTYFPDHTVTAYLNGLVAQAHEMIYATHGKGNLKEGLRFFTHHFPALFHERIPFFLVALSVCCRSRTRLWLYLGQSRLCNSFSPAGSGGNRTPRPSRPGNSGAMPLFPVQSW